MSAFASLASALPLKADVAAVGRESPKLTRFGHSARFDVNGNLRPGTAIHIVLGQGPLADHKTVVRPMLLNRPFLTQPKADGIEGNPDIARWSAGQILSKPGPSGLHDLAFGQCPIELSSSVLGRSHLGNFS